MIEAPISAVYPRLSIVLHAPFIPFCECSGFGANFADSYGLLCIFGITMSEKTKRRKL